MKTAITTVLAILLSTPVLAADSARDLNTLRSFPEIEDRAEWEKRAEEIREHVQMSCGLWPLPPRTPLNTHISGRVERDGYTIEKVHFETYPGFFLAGNLYRPLGKGKGPFPAILNPHGHWKEGRMADQELGSIAARCISFARQGMIAFSYDMVGYNDTIQVDHKFASDPKNLLWNISLMGLQTWNSIRALDFLESLPDVDKKRLACTGESGGGTQTFILGAIDDRLAAQAPIVMVSHSMQGGCLCENAPGLRVDYSNMEIAAAPAPRPQILVGATGDWTKRTMEVEGPSIENIYELVGAGDRFGYTIFDYEHNYNKTSREAVYAAFGKWLLKNENADDLKEQPYKKEPDADLRVFPDGKLPAGALKESELIQSMVQIYSRQLDQLKPTDAKSLAEWKRQMTGAWEHALQLQHVRGSIPKTNGNEIAIAREPDDETVRFTVQEPGEKKNGLVVILASPDENNNLGKTLLDQGSTVVTLKNRPKQETDQFKNFYHVYNRTRVQDTVADIKVAAEYAAKRFPQAKVVLIGEGDSGPSALLAAPLVAAVAADGAGLNEADDANLLKPNVFFPGIRRIGSLQGVASLAAPNPIFVHHVGWDHGWMTALYSRSQNFRNQKEQASDAELVDWVARLAQR